MRITSKHLLLCGLPLLIAAGGCGLGPLTNKGYIGDNVIRMAQPTKGDLETVLETDQIKSIVNLRGPNAGKSWYDTEFAFAEANDIDFYSVRLSSGRLPTQEQLADLIEIFQTAEHPLMMHCEGGADRSGFGSVVYRLVILDEPLDEALDSFSIWYGHVEQNSPLDQLFEFYREEADGRSFEEWFDQDYDVERLNQKLSNPP